MTRKSGYTLIEMIVALVLSTMVVGFAFMLLQGSRGSFMRVKGSIALQADTREAVRMMENDLRNLGLKVANMYSSRILSTVNCPLAFVDPASGDSSSFLHINRSDWTDPGDEITFAQYLPDGAGNVSCAPTNLQVVRYRLRSTDSVLTRSEANSFAGISSAPEVPLCESVVAFQTEYALLDVDSVLWDSTSNWYSPWLSVSKSGNKSTLSGWAPLVMLGAGTSTLHDIVQGSTYRVEFDLEPNTVFADTSTGQNHLVVGFWDGLAPVDTVPVWTGSTTSRHVIVDIEASKNISDARVLVQGKLSTIRPTATLSISSLRVAQRSLTGYRWLSDPTLAQKKRVQAVKLSVVTRTEREVQGTSPWAFDRVGDLPGLNIGGAEARKGYAFFQRIVPVVNHGY